MHNGKLCVPPHFLWAMKLILFHSVANCNCRINTSVLEIASEGSLLAVAVSSSVVDYE